MCIGPKCDSFHTHPQNSILDLSETTLILMELISFISIHQSHCTHIQPTLYNRESECWYITRFPFHQLLVLISNLLIYLLDSCCGFNTHSLHMNSYEVWMSDINVSELHREELTNQIHCLLGLTTKKWRDGRLRANERLKSIEKTLLEERT